MSAIAYLQLAAGVLFNLGTIYFLKKANGFTVFWPSVWALVTISLTQWMISRVMMRGMDVGLSITTCVVSVMIGSVLMGVFVFGESISPQKIIGFGIAVVGVIIASLAKA